MQGIKRMQSHEVYYITAHTKVRHYKPVYSTKLVQSSRGWYNFDRGTSYLLLVVDVVVQLKTKIMNFLEAPRPVKASREAPIRQLGSQPSFQIQTSSS